MRANQNEPARTASDVRPETQEIIVRAEGTDSPTQEKLVHAEKPAIARQATDSDLDQVNKIQAELFPEDLHELGERSDSSDLLILEKPGNGVVGYAFLGWWDEYPVLFYLAVLENHRADSKFLIKAILDERRKEGEWWHSDLKVAAAYALFKSVAKDKYVTMRKAGEPSTHPRTGEKYHLISFKVTDKEFTGERTSKN